MNEQIVWNYLYGKLNNPYGTAALMGNLFAESSLNPINSTGAKKFGLTNQEYTDIVDAHKNDSFITDGVAYGLAQWCYHTRKQGLLNLAKTRGKSVGDIYMQLDYLWMELQRYTTVLKMLFNGTNIREISDIVMLKYEKPANKSEAMKERRARYGQKYYDMFMKDAYVRAAVNKNAIRNLYEELDRALRK